MACCRKNSGIIRVSWSAATEEDIIWGLMKLTHFLGVLLLVALLVPAAVAAGEPVAPRQACDDGRKAGVAKAGSGATAVPALLANSWDSPTVAREKTEAAIASSADVIYQNVDAAANGVFQAVQDANKKGK